MTHAQKAKNGIEKAEGMGSNQTTARGTMRIGSVTFQKVIREQEHNLFAQTVRWMTGACCLGHESLATAQSMEEVPIRHNLMMQRMSQKGLKLFGERGFNDNSKLAG